MNSPGPVANNHFWPRSRVFTNDFSAKAVAWCRTADDCFSRWSVISLPIFQNPIKVILVWFRLCSAISRTHFTSKCVAENACSLLCSPNSEAIVLPPFFMVRSLMRHDHVIYWAKVSGNPDRERYCQIKNQDTFPVCGD